MEREASKSSQIPPQAEYEVEKQVLIFSIC